MNEMAILGKEGDVKIMWDSDKEEEVKTAEKAFKDLLDKKYLAFRSKKDGSRGEMIKSFDKYAEKMIMVPLVVGG